MNMSVKDLFDHGTSIVKLKSGSLGDLYAPVESYRNIQEVITKQERFIPPVDFLTTSNFARFGSAELYYDGAIKRIYGNYPYDGTLAEKNRFDNSSLYIEKYIFDNFYPRSTGYAIFCADGWGSRTAISSDGYATPSTQEYVQFRGGPHTSSFGWKDVRTSFSSSNVYDTNIYDNEGLPSNFGKGTRSSNLRFTGSDGATVEFWLKKPSFDTTNTTHREVIFDLWNNQTSSGHSGSTCYGRMMIELDGQYSTGSSFLVTLMSGTTGFQHRRVGNLAGTSSLSDWNHYAFSFRQSGSYLNTKFYVNGGLNEEVDSEFVIGGFEHAEMNARIGSLITGPTGSAAPIGAGKFSGSLDEFRYWKAARNSKQISDFYYVPVHGGTNTDIANATLGVYYKFNEGITGTSSTDSTVLDYSGRVSNGYWIGYGSNSRNTGSAIVQSSASNSEFRDPIIHPNHTEVAVLHRNLLLSGTVHDHQNNAMLFNTMPAWITDQADEEGAPDLKNLCHILGVYLDKLYLQIESLPQFNSAQYLSSSYKAFPFYKNAIEGKGLEIPELFVEADILEKFAQRTDTYNFTLDLNEVKNLIYQNIHSNLVNIYKTKGTEKAVRNVLRAFGIGDDLIKVNLYANNAKYLLSDNIHHQLLKKKYVNFSKRGNTGAVVYQTTEAGNPNSAEFISGSKGDEYENTLGFTAEANVMFPKYFVEETDDYYDRNWLTSSLFGMHRADHTASNDVTTWSPSGSDWANFQVQFIKDKEYSRSGYFRISSSNSPYPIPVMTSSMFYGVYDDNNWLISVTLKPERLKELAVVSGSSHKVVEEYNVVFSGYNKVLGTTVNSFYLTSSLETTASRDFLKSDKRVYAGAYRDNMTGTLLYRNDTKIAEMRYWGYSLEDEEVERHAVDIENVGILNPFRIIGNLDRNFINKTVRKSDTLLLHWNFNNVTSSDASGEFRIQDASSGSYEIRDRLGIYGNYSGYQHTGKAKYFLTSSKNILAYQFLNNAKFRHYEQIVSSDMINILNNDDKIFGSNQRPTDYHFTIEKSMYDVISQEILNMFAGIVDFNNLIGEPVNRYREEYKDLTKLRQIFFEKVGTTPDINRYLDFYKWFDDALSLVIRQLIPATADMADELYNVVEEHALERNKYKTPFPTLEFDVKDPEASIRGIEELEYSWKFGHSPLPSSPRPQYEKGLYWKSRSEKDDLELTIRSASFGPYTTTAAGAAYANSVAIDIGRKELRDIIHANPHFSQSLPVLAEFDGNTYEGNAHAIRTFAKTYKFRVTNPVESVIKGGVNFSPGKSMEKVYNAVMPHGPIEAHGSIGGVGCGGCKLPVNILFARSEDFEPYKDLYDPLPPQEKVKKKMKVIHGRDSNKEALGYATAKSGFFFPMNIVSGTIDPDELTGALEHFIVANNAYERQISGNITNIHNDVYGPHMEKPMQGPFTEYAVGGHQSRHIGLNTGSWTSGYSHQLNRPEAWRIHIGRCPEGNDLTAVGIVGADYPPPDLKLSATGNHQVSDVYPYIKHPRAAYYRDGTAKRPVNIGNIYHTTGSPTILGNFNNRYDYVQTAGRSSQKRYLKDTVDHNYGDRPPGVFGSSSIETVFHHTASLLPTRLLEHTPGQPFPTPTTASTYYYQTTNVHSLAAVEVPPEAPVGGLGNVFGGDQINAMSNRFAIEPNGTIFIVPKRRKRQGIFSTRFSAPGGPEVLSPGYLDIHTGEYSVYNSVNFRNLAVRSSGSGEVTSYRTNPDVDASRVLFKSIRANNHMNTSSTDERLHIRQGLRTVLTRHSGKSYSDPQYGRVPELHYLDELPVTFANGRPQGGTLTAVHPHSGAVSYHKIFRNKKFQLRDITKASRNGGILTDHILTVDPTVITGSWFDNYWVQHTIPRSDINYSWITASMLHDGFIPSAGGWFGYLPHSSPGGSMPLSSFWKSGLVSGSAYRTVSPDPTPSKMIAEGPWGSGSVYKTPYNFLSASEYVVYVQTGSTAPNRLGADKYARPDLTLNHIPIDFVGLNTIIVDAVTSSMASLGFHLDHYTSSDGRSSANTLLPDNPEYINTSIVDGLIYGSLADGRHGIFPFLNMLILHRQGPYGWPGWKQTRGTSHPVMRYERARNILRAPTRVLSSSAWSGLQKRYAIQGVTSKYKPVQVDIAHSDETPPDYDSAGLEPFARFVTTNYNQIVGLQSEERDTAFFYSVDSSNTWWDSLASTLGTYVIVGTPPGSPGSGEFSYKINYRETVWPSSLMVYMSSSRGRVGYSDRTWRAIHSERVDLGASRNNSKDVNRKIVRGRRFTVPSGSRMTQSSWPLDAHTDFATRVDSRNDYSEHVNLGGAAGNNTVSGGINDPARMICRGAFNPYNATEVTGGANLYWMLGTSSTFYGYNSLDMYGYGPVSGGYSKGEGELQNCYSMFHGGHSILSGNAPGGVRGLFANGPAFPYLTQIHPTALYARKQTLASYRSVVGPYGIDIPETASNETVAKLSLTSSGLGGGGNTATGSGDVMTKHTYWGNIDLYGGEAAWEAGPLAGFISHSVDDFGALTPYFVSASSLPWYDKYEDYVLDLRAVAKEYSIVPEFRSARWLSTSSIGIPFTAPLNIPWYHTLEIVTGGATGSYNEALDNNPEKVVFKVIKGDNLRDLEGIHGQIDHDDWADGAMGIARLKLTMEAVVKFVPYEGFYPAQRTLQLVEQFWKSHGPNVRTQWKAGAAPPGSPGTHGHRMFSEPQFTSTVNTYNASRRISTQVLQDRSATDLVTYTLSGYPFYSASYEGGVTWPTGASDADCLLNGKHFARPLNQTLFAPGILYNTIKSGIAVDYPVMFSESFGRCQNNMAVGDLKTNYWAISGSVEGVRSIFDSRIPFEAIINPGAFGGHLGGREIVDMEPHPWSALPHTYTTLTPGGDLQYSKMMSNFCAATADFFLNNSKFTRMESEAKSSFYVESGSIYGMRVKLYRSMNKDRDYSQNPKARTISNHGVWGGGGVGWAPLGATSSITNKAYPIPQDPIPSGTYPGYIHWVTGTNEGYGWPGQAGLKETITMYSRPGAFGPPLSGRNFHPLGVSTGVHWGSTYPWQVESSGTMDCYNGYNWAYTPGYYHGQSWVDIVYMPSESADVNIDQVFASDKTYVKHWRADAGPTASFQIKGGTASPDGGAGYVGHTIIPDNLHTSGTIVNSSGHFYGGDNVNDNAMQMSGSFSLFRTTEVPEYGWTILSTGHLAPEINANAGAKSWVIEPRFETPILNFNDQYGIRPIQSSDITVPLYASESVPRGMWHQFGTIPGTSPGGRPTGIFFEVNDIPVMWLENHPHVVGSVPTIYNKNYAGAARPHLWGEYRSLAETAGFAKGYKRLGEIKENKKVSEAIVAVPYYLDGDTKRFFNLQVTREQINEYRQKRHFATNVDITNLLPQVINPDSGRLLGNDGGLLYLFDKMERFVFPPQLDFLRYPEFVLGAEPATTPPLYEDGHGPRVMYVFEFEHEFDKDDLSYMWQNLAPRNYKSYKKMKREISHDMLNSAGAYEFLNRDEFLMFSKQIRWMVFKVKQRGMHNYADILTGDPHIYRDGVLTDLNVFGPSAFPPNPTLHDPTADLWPDEHHVVEHNWPYDYFSLIEQAKMTVDVEFRPVSTAAGFTTIPYGSSEQWDPTLPPVASEPPAVPTATPSADPYATTGGGPPVITPSFTTSGGPSPSSYYTAGSTTTMGPSSPTVPSPSSYYTFSAPGPGFVLPPVPYASIPTYFSDED